MTGMFRILCLGLRLEKAQDWTWKRWTALILLECIGMEIEWQETRTAIHWDSWNAPWTLTWKSANYINIKTINIFYFLFQFPYHPDILRPYKCLHLQQSSGSFIIWRISQTTSIILFFRDTTNKLHMWDFHVKARNKNWCEIIFQANV